MLPNLYRLDEVITEPETAGIFSALETAGTMPWEDDIDADVLDLDYVFNHSGRKFCGPLLQRFAEANVDGADDPDLTATQLAKIAKILIAHFGEDWTRLYATLSAEYSPLSNYDMTETVDETVDDDGTITDEGSDDLTHGHVVTGGGTSTATTSVYAYDNSTATPSETSTLTPATTETNSGIDQRAIDNTKTLDTTRTTDRTLTRSGNIGVTTSQQMLESERQAWLWDFLHVVYHQIDTLLLLPIY